MAALNFTTFEQLENQVNKARCAKKDCLSWKEFINFAFNKDSNQGKNADWCF